MSEERFNEILDWMARHPFEASYYTNICYELIQENKELKNKNDRWEQLKNWLEKSRDKRYNWVSLNGSEIIEISLLNKILNKMKEIEEN